MAVVFAAANRDPERFPARDEFLPQREDSAKHLASAGESTAVSAPAWPRTELRLLTTPLLAAGTIRLAGELVPAALEGGAHMGLTTLPLTIARA